VDDLRRLTELYALQRKRAHPRVVLPALHAHIASLRALLPLTASDSQRRQLAIMAGQTAICAGQCWHGLHNLGEALAAYSVALQLAHEIGEQSLRAAALTSQSMLYSTRLQEGLAPGSEVAVEMLDTAETAAGLRSDPYLRGWVFGTRAYKRAGMAESAQCGRDLDASARALSQATLEPEGFYSLFDRSWQTAHQGKCALLTGDTQEGMRLFQRAIDDTDEQLVSTRATLTVDLGISCLQAGEAELAAGVLADGARLARAAGLTIATRRIADLTAGSQSHPAIKDLRLSLDEQPG
jgi:hypothetical protein